MTLSFSQTAVDHTHEKFTCLLHQVYLTTAFQRVGDELSSYPSDNSLTVQMGPTQRDMVQAVVDFVEKMAWKNVALVSHRASGWFGRTHIS